MAPDSPRPETDGRRASPRRRVLKGARIVFNNKQSTLTCTVRNLSESGALLTLPTILGVPEEFSLLIGDAPARQCRVVHRAGDQLGVRFVSC